VRFVVPVALAVAVVAGGCGGTRTITRTVAVARGAAPPQRVSWFGRIRSLTRAGGEYRMRLDPAWLLTGLTASDAMFEDHGTHDVANDFYEVDPDHRLLTFRVAADARVKVLTRDVGGSRITVAQLAQLVAGRNPLGRPLFEPLTTGFWIVADGDTVRSLEQQYRA
jgi:hypothetical protein